MMIFDGVACIQENEVNTFFKIIFIVRIYPIRDPQKKLELLTQYPLCEKKS